jgi:hypothetical protein
MKPSRKYVLSILVGVTVITISLTSLEEGRKASRNVLYDPVIPRTWDSAAIHDFELPLADSKASPKPISEKFYYQLPERVVYKSYPVYHPDHEPEGYQEWLRAQEPQIVFDPTLLKTESDWIAAGEMLFDHPIDTFGAIVDQRVVADKDFYSYTEMPLTKEGIVPYIRYVIGEKGKVKVGNLSCGMCHTRVFDDGTVVKGAQGNFPGDRATAYGLISAPDGVTKFLTRVLFAAPWVQDDPHAVLASSSRDAVVAAFAAVPQGAFGRQGTSVLFPPQVQDLIGVKDRKYLDHGGLGRHREIGDMMRYIAMNQSLDFLNTYDGYIPIGKNENILPTPDKVPRGFGAHDRYSEEQLFAIASFVYSLTPPVNPNKPSSLTKRGEVVFKQEGCVTCHTPPLYTNNMLTPADGFEVPEEHWKKYDVFGISVGTDPSYTLKTRRGTGYYKVPSLKGVWYRGPFFHNAWLATLEDVFDPKRLRDDYVPTAFKTVGVVSQPMRGHEFGLDLSEKDKKALIAFLRTL